MKGIINIIKLILIMILTICVISIGIITIVSSTILDKDYVINKLEETNFYNETYKLVESNFENYIYQSGLDETVLEDICTEEKVKEDINIIISNIYEGTNKTIDTKPIEENLNKRIESLNVKNSRNESAINEFVKHICEEYTNTLVHTKYETAIHEQYMKITNVMSKAKLAIMIVALADIIMLLAINAKKISTFIRAIGIALFANGLFEVIVCNIINSKVNIAGIKILNDAFSETIVKIAQEIISKIQTIGIIAIVISIILIIVYAIIEPKKETE